jgi:LacI family transcriptional regulator
MDDSVPHVRDGDRPTLKTIAALTGLSIATVSRALQDAPDIGEDTKRRVRDEAARVGYRPNRAGVRLRTGKTNVIALVLSSLEDVMNHTARLIYSVSAALKGSPCHMIVMPFAPGEDPMTPIRDIVETGSADGVIINQTEPGDPRVRYMQARGFPFATHGRTEMGLAHPCFDYDNGAFARVAVQALAARGRRRLALIAPPPAQSYAAHMTAWFLDEAQRLGLGAEVFSGVTSDSPATEIEGFVAARFAGAERPDGLVVGSTTVAMASVAGAEGCGLRIGGEFDLAAKEAIRFLNLFRREMIVLNEDVSRAGTFLARAVMDVIEGRQPGSPAQHLDVPDDTGWMPRSD